MSFDTAPNYDVFNVNGTACHVIIEGRTVIDGASPRGSANHSPAMSDSWDSFEALPNAVSDELKEDLGEIMQQIPSWNQPWGAVYRTHDHASYSRNCAVIGSHDSVYAYSNRRVYEISELVDPIDIEEVRFHNVWLFQTQNADYFIVWLSQCGCGGIETPYVILSIGVDDTLQTVHKGTITASVKKLSFDDEKIEYLDQNGDVVRDTLPVPLV